MTTATQSLGMIVATLVMLAFGIKEKRLEWKRREDGWWRKRKPKPPSSGRGIAT